MTDRTDTLIAVASAVVTAVKAVDLDYDLVTAMQSLTVTCCGSGQFNIQIESDAKIDQPRLEATIRQLIIGEPVDESAS